MSLRFARVHVDFKLFILIKIHCNMFWLSDIISYMLQYLQKHGMIITILWLISLRWKRLSLLYLYSSHSFSFVNEEIIAKLYLLCIYHMKWLWHLYKYNLIIVWFSHRKLYCQKMKMLIKEKTYPKINFGFEIKIVKVFAQLENFKIIPSNCFFPPWSIT